jgi:flagellin
MSTVINTNIAAMSAQRALTSTSGQLSTALQRLTSGLRINSAKDDAAGLAIAERLTTQVRGYQQAIRNAGDGISVAQTAEGGLDSIMVSLQRMRELAVQSANFTNTLSDRQAIQQEANQMREEIQRVASQTKFNGQALLDGTFNGATFQVGANVGEIIQISGVDSAQTTALGVYNGVDVVGGTALDVVTDAVGGQKTINVNGAGVLNISGDSATAVAASINKLGISGLHAYADPTDSSKLAIAYQGSGAVVLNNVTANGATSNLTNTSVTANKLSALDMTTVAGANKAILTIDAALSSVSGSRAKLGATINRFEQTVSNLRITAENQTASRSRIQDADFAQETAALTRAQILQQSGMSVLAQANSIPQNVLALLRQ